jgi:tyrosyl-tRNA synthetase
MSVPDSTVIKYFELCTYTPLSEIENIKKELSRGENPRGIKMRLAREIVAIYHGEEVAEKAENDFTETFQKGNIPEDVPEVAVSEGVMLYDLLKEKELVSSRSEFSRLVNEGAVVDTEEGKITDPKVEIKKETVFRIGKKRFLRVVLK